MPERDCIKCTDRQKVAWGCDAPAREKIEIEGNVIERCPRLPFKPGHEDEAGIGEVLWYYAAYKRGQLPEPGGLMDQSDYMMTCFRIIDGAVNTVESIQQAKRDKESNRNQHGGRGGGRLVPVGKKKG